MIREEENKAGTGRSVLLTRVVREGLTEEVTFEPRPKGGAKGAGHGPPAFPSQNLVHPQGLVWTCLGSPGNPSRNSVLETSRGGRQEQ